MEKGSLDYSDDEKNQIFQDIFSGKIDLENLPEDLYHDIASILKDGVKSGYADAGTKIDFDISDTELIADLQENIYMFSGAKTFTQVKEMMAELVDEKGQIVPFNDFRESARGIFDMFNETYLKTEYDTTIGMAQNAAKWNEIDKQKDSNTPLSRMPTRPRSVHHWTVSACRWMILSGIHTCHSITSTAGALLPRKTRVQLQIYPPKYR
jgi:hypothetical protein